LNCDDGLVSLGFRPPDVLVARVTCSLTELGILDNQADHYQHSEENEDGE
jgi:hypothetical protein